MSDNFVLAICERIGNYHLNRSQIELVPIGECLPLNDFIVTNGYGCTCSRIIHFFCERKLLVSE